MSKRAPKALALPWRRASQPSTPSSSVTARLAATAAAAIAGIRLADQRGDQRDEDRAGRGDLVRGAEARERMMPLQEADRQADDQPTNRTAAFSA